MRLLEHLSARLILGCMLAAALAAVAHASEADARSFVDRLQPGDRVQITVQHEEKISGEYEIDMQGQLTFPLVGQLPAADRTAQQLKQELTQALQTYILQPEVFVNRAGFAKNISILGRVKSQGAFNYTPGLTLMQLISQAGGFDTSADKKKIRVVRHADGQKKILYFNASEIIAGRQNDPEIWIGDIVFVPESLF